MAMTLPADFDTEFARAQKYGVLDEDVNAARKRAELALESTPAGAVGAATLGPGEWAGRMLTELQAAIHDEICAKDGSGLKPDYAGKLGQALTKEGVAQVTAVVLQVAHAINPALAVSSVGIYVAIWLLKVGLNYWCKAPVKV